MMDRMHTRLGIADITLANPINKTIEQTAAISSTTCGYLNQQELNEHSEVNQHYEHITRNQQQQQQQRIQQRIQHSAIPDSIDATTSTVQAPTSSAAAAAHNHPLHTHSQQPQHLIQTLNAPAAQYTTRTSNSNSSSTFASNSLGKPSFSSFLQHTIDNSKHDNHLQQHLSEEHLHLPNHSVYNHLHHHTQSHYTLNHLNHNHRTVTADCLTAAAIAANSPVTSPSAISISSKTSGCVSVTPSSAMAVAAAAHLHHNSQTSPMTNLHQNMGSLMNSGNSAR